MATAMHGARVQSKIQMLLYGEQFTGKSTIALQLMYLQNQFGKPLSVLYLDPENGSIDDFLPALEDNGVDLRNIYIVYTQSLSEVREYINKAKNKETFFALDEDGNETETPILNSEGLPFAPDAIVVDGTSILNMTSKQGLVEFSKRRAKVKADKASVVGEERFVSVEQASMELKDWGTLNFSGQNLILDLMGSGKHFIVTARETDEKESKETTDDKGKACVISVTTGRKIPDGFKGMGYNVKTEIRMFRDPDDYSTVKAFVVKDRSGVHMAGEIIEDPSLLDWQSVITRTGSHRTAPIKNSLEESVQIEVKKQREGYAPEEYTGDKTLQASPKDSIAKLQEQIKAAKKAFNPVQVSAIKAKLSEKNLPIVTSSVADIGVLKQVLEILQSA